MDARTSTQPYGLSLEGNQKPVSFVSISLNLILRKVSCTLVGRGLDCR